MPAQSGPYAHAVEGIKRKIESLPAKVRDLPDVEAMQARLHRLSVSGGFMRERGGVQYWTGLNDKTNEQSGGQYLAGSTVQPKDRSGLQHLTESTVHMKDRSGLQYLTGSNAHPKDQTEQQSRRAPPQRAIKTPRAPRPASLPYWKRANQQHLLVSTANAWADFDPVAHDLEEGEYEPAELAALEEQLILLEQKILHDEQESLERLAWDSWKAPKHFRSGEDVAMADVHERREQPHHHHQRHGGHGGRGGGFGGGGGGGFSRKRRYRDDDEHDRRPRREYHEPPSVRVRKQIFAIADSPMRDPVEDCAAIAAMIADHQQDDYFCNSISDSLPILALEQPMKIPFVAAMILNLNQKKPEMLGQFIDKFAARVRAAMEAGEWRSVKQLLRVLAFAHALFEGDGVFGVFDELFNRAADLQAASPEDTMGPELVKVIMHTLPYAMAYGANDQASKANEILEKTGIIAGAPPLMDDIVYPYFSQGESSPRLQIDIGLLQKQLLNEAANNWPLTFMPRPYKDPSAEDLIDGMSSTQRHAFPTLEIPATAASGSQVFFPKVYFSVYADQDVETVPPTSTLAASVIRDCLVDTINFIDFNRGQAARFLIDMDCYWARDTFAKRATPFDKLKNMESGSTWKTEDLAVDAIFSQLMRLPIPEHKLVFYHSMIFETCRIAPAAIAPSLGRAIRYIYRNLGTMDLELTHRFMDWFAHHLSNFDFRWKWVEWVEDVAQSPLHPRRAFVQGALDKEVRLSFAKRIRETLPEPYHVMIPSTRDNDIPEFKYNAEQTPYHTEAKEILSCLKRKAPDSEFFPIFARIVSAEAENTASTSPSDPVDPTLAATDAFITALCYIGSKSLSHVLSYIERNKERLLSLATTGSVDPASPHAGADPERTQAQIVASVINYWRNTQAGVAVNIVDKLLNYTIVSPAAVVAWALGGASGSGNNDDQGSAQSPASLSYAWLYEMVSTTLTKVSSRVRQITAARSQPSLPPSHATALEETLVRESAALGQLFTRIEDALAPVAQGSNDAMVEGDLSDDDTAALRFWGTAWRRAFGRKRVVEEMLVKEAQRAFPPPGEEVPADEAANGENGGVDTGMADADGTNAEAEDAAVMDEAAEGIAEV